MDFEPSFYLRWLSCVYDGFAAQHVPTMMVTGTFPVPGVQVFRYRNSEGASWPHCPHRGEGCFGFGLLRFVVGMCFVRSGCHVLYVGVSVVFRGWNVILVGSARVHLIWITYCVVLLLVRE